MKRTGNPTNFATLIENSNKLDALRAVIGHVKEVTEVHSVAIRLQEGDDFPYYTTIGFSEQFVRAENYLCKRDSIGNIVKDDNCDPCLDCMCGKVIRGNLSTDMPFVTERLSFCSNDTTTLLLSCKGDDLKDTRNRCNSEGYESVLLTPISVNGVNIGMIQLNDFKKNVLSDEVVKFVEDLSEEIGIIFQNTVNQENLKNEKRKALMDEIQILRGDIQNLLD